MLRLVIQSLNSDCLAIGVYSDNALQLEQTFYSLFNAGAIDIANYRGPSQYKRRFSESYPLALHLGNPVPTESALGFRYALTTSEKLWAWLRHKASLAFDTDRLSTPSLEAYLDRKASEALASIEKESFLHYGEQYFSNHDEMTTPERCRQAKEEIAELRGNPDALPLNEWYKVPLRA